MIVIHGTKEGPETPTRTGIELVSFYRSPPKENSVSLEQFASWAMDRYKLLRRLDAATIKGLKGSEWLSLALHSSNQYVPLHTADDQLKDVVSHHTLRLAFAGATQQDRTWWINQEAKLLKFRLEGQDLTRFLHDNGLNFQMKTEAELGEANMKLLYSFLCFGLSHQEAEAERTRVRKTGVYLVPFQQAAELLASRRVFLLGGFVHVSQKELMSIILGRFRASLADMVQQAVKMVPIARQDARLCEIMNELTRPYQDASYKSKHLEGGVVKPGDIDALSTLSFPLCMRNLHSQLRSAHHLRHAGRIQYGLFLKAIGLSMEDSLQFWKSELERSVGADKFDKEYAYAIRHNYGREGKRTDYSALSCAKIISGDAPGHGEHHGCPFKHMEWNRLEQLLHSSLLAMTGSESKRKVMDQIHALLAPVDGGPHYQIACRRVFEATHAGSKDVTVVHPNTYYDQSRKFYADQGAPSAASAAATAAAATAPNAPSTDTAPPTSDATATGDTAATAFGSSAAPLPSDAGVTPMDI